MFRFQKKNGLKTGDREIDQLIIDGQNYLKKMQEADIAIEDETVSEQIRKLEEISKKIFEFVAENPKKAPQIRKFMKLLFANHSKAFVFLR